MHAAVLEKINSTYEYSSKEVILEEFEAYFGVLEREVFMSCWGDVEDFFYIDIPNFYQPKQSTK